MMRRACLAAVCVLVSAATARADDTPAPAEPTVAPPPVPPAASKGTDTIYLKNGGIVRGTIVEAIPDRPARIQLVTGEIWSIGWTYVDHVVVGSGASSAPPASAGPSAPPGPAVPSGPMVRLHVESPRKVEIMGHPLDGSPWVTVCSGACDKLVPLGWEYETNAEGVKSSPPFVLKADAGGTATVHVDPGDKSAFSFGVAGLGVGAVAAVVGLVVTNVGAQGHNTTTTNGVTTTQPVDPATLPAGIVTLSIGALMAIIGGIVAVENSSTTVTQVSPRTAQAALPPLHFVDAPREGLRLPDVATSTLVDLRF